MVPTICGNSRSRWRCVRRASSCCYAPPPPPPFLEASEMIQNRTSDRKGGGVVCASIGTLVRTPFRYRDLDKRHVEARVEYSRVCGYQELSVTQRGGDKNCRRMLHHYVSFCGLQVQTCFWSRRNAVWRDCRRLREARGWRGVLVRVRGCDIPPWTLCYSLRRQKRWWILRGWVFRKGGFVLFERENSTPRIWESVCNLCILTNVVGHEGLGITPTTRSKRSVSRHCFVRWSDNVYSPRTLAWERTWSRVADGTGARIKRTGLHARC